MKIREVKEKTIHVIIAITIIKEQMDIDFVHLKIA